MPGEEGRSGGFTPLQVFPECLAVHHTPHEAGTLLPRFHAGAQDRSHQLCLHPSTPKSSHSLFYWGLFLLKQILKYTPLIILPFDTMRLFQEARHLPCELVRSALYPRRPAIVVKMPPACSALESNGNDQMFFPS